MADETQMQETQEVAETVEVEKAEPKKRVSRNVNNLPIPSVAEFIYHFNQANSKKEAVRLLQNAGFHMTINALQQRETKYRKLNLGIKEMPAATRRINAEDVARELAELQAKADADAETVAS